MLRHGLQGTKENDCTQKVATTYLIPIRMLQYFNRLHSFVEISVMELIRFIKSVKMAMR